MKANRGHSGRIEVTRGREYIQACRDTWSNVYAKACEHDGIPKGATIVVLSADNPFAPFVDRAADEFFKAVREYQAGGYVGLSMRQDGSAQ